MIDRSIRPCYVALLIIALSGCATIANTPAQDRAWAAADRCRALLPPDGNVQRVEPNGRIWVAGSTGTGNFGPFFACVRNEGPR
jgi:hypothetical protein